MQRKLQSTLLILLLISQIVVNAQPPKTLVLDGEILQKNRELIASNSIEKKAALQQLIKRSDKIMSEGKLYSVMHKKQTPPSGDKHDYMSTGPYWWPDPTKPDGLPYIRKDGQINPTYNDITDTNEMDKMISDVETIALAYFFTNDEKYASYAAKLITTWFLDAVSKQNPNLNFGQGIPGINTGRGIGLIETSGFHRVIDAAILLQGSKAWTTDKNESFKTWIKAFLDWMINDPKGKDELASKNNHGTYYDVQLITYALFTNQKELAQKHLNNVTKARFQVQFTEDGKQPLELERTASWNYTHMNLLGFMYLGRLAEHLNVDLYSFSVNNNLGIKTTLDWFLPYYKKEKTWQYEQIKEVKNGTAVKILKMAALKYKNQEYNSIAQQLDAKEFSNVYNSLLF